jgi:hypothetical protein
MLKLPMLQNTVGKRGTAFAARGAGRRHDAKPSCPTFFSLRAAQTVFRDEKLLQLHVIAKMQDTLSQKVDWRGVVAFGLAGRSPRVSRFILGPVYQGDQLALRNVHSQFLGTRSSAILQGLSHLFCYRREEER